MAEKGKDRPKTKAERREQIKARYSGLCTDDVEFIPARTRISFFEDDSPKRVVIYIRVSTVTNTFLQHGRSAVSI